MPDDAQERFERSVDTFSRTGIAGALWGLPVLALVSLGAARSLTLAYVFTTAPLLFVFLWRRHRRT